MLFNAAALLAIATGLVNAAACEARTYDHYIPRVFQEFYDSGTFAQTPTPAYIKLSTIPVPKTKGAKAALDFAKKHLAESIVNHSIRAYYFAAAMILHPGFPSTKGKPQLTQDQVLESVYVTTLLHDIGMADDIAKLLPEVKTLTFEIQGGIIIRDVLKAVGGVPDIVISDAVDGTSVHTTGFPAGIWSIGAASAKLGSNFDGLGLADPFIQKLINNKTLDEINRAYPRLQIGQFYSDKLTHELATKPGALTSVVAQQLNSTNFEFLRHNVWDQTY